MHSSPSSSKPFHSRAVQFLYFTLLAIAGLGLVQLSGCQNNNNVPANSTSPKLSSIHVVTSGNAILIESPSAIFELSLSGYLKPTLKRDGHSFSLDDPGTSSGQRIILAGKPINDFPFDLAHAQVTDVAGKIGTLGKHVEVTGITPGTNLAETLVVEVYDDFPEVALLSASFRNAGSNEIKLDTISLQQHLLNASLSDPQAAPHDLTAFFGSSLAWGKDEVFCIPAKFSQQNPFSLPIAVGDDLGGAGGGIPVIAFWTRDVGVAIGHVETLPLVLSIPVQTRPDGLISTSIEIPAATSLKPGEVYATPRTFLSISTGDYFQPLNRWSHILDREGLPRPTFNQEDYAVSWCSWGYKANITPQQMLDTIPKLKELGIHWATIDDRWYNNYGDWLPRSDTFPVDSMRKMVDNFHQQGIKVQLWWLPIGVEDGHYSDGGRNFVLSDVVKQHPDWLGTRQKRQARSHDSQSSRPLPRRPRSSGLLQAAHAEIHPRLGFRRPQARQYFRRSPMLQPQASSQIAQ